MLGFDVCCFAGCAARSLSQCALPLITIFCFRASLNQRRDGQGNVFKRRGPTRDHSYMQCALPAVLCSLGLPFLDDQTNLG